MPSTILLVDDEVNILLALKRTLRSTGHTVLTANSAGDALAILADHSVDLIISDYLMPHMTGIELLSQIEKLQPNAIRIILSAHADFDIVTQAIRSGSVHRYLAKPWTNSVLVEQINSLLEHEGDKTSNQKATNVTDASVPAPEKIAVLGEYNPALNQTILDSIKDGIATLNAQGELLSINPAMVDLFGYQGKELIGQHVNMLMPTRNTGQSREERSRELGYLNTSSMGNAKKLLAVVKVAMPSQLN